VVVNKGCAGGVSVEVVIGGIQLDTELVMESSVLLSLALGRFF